MNFEAFTIGTLIVVVLLAVVGYWRARGVRAAASRIGAVETLVTGTTDSGV